MAIILMSLAKQGEEMRREKDTRKGAGGWRYD
jgi:hypothetical protein